MIQFPYSGPIPPLGYGTYPLKDDAARQAVQMALEVGLRHIDTAQWYDNEEAVGEALTASRLSRGELFVATKIHPGNLEADRFRSSLEESLQKLRLASVDLLLIHWPPKDPAAFEAALEQLAAVEESGLTRLIGVSNFAPGQFARAKELLGNKLICNQVEFHPYLDQSRLMKVSQTIGVPLAAYASVARGMVLTDRVITDIAKRIAQTPAAVVLRWILQQGVTAVCQTSNRVNAENNLAALSFALSESDMAAISCLRTRHVRVVDLPDIAPDWDQD